MKMEYDEIGMEGFPDDERLRICRWVAICEYLDKRETGRMMGFAIASYELTRIMGKSVVSRSVERKYYAWVQGGRSWKALADWRRASMGKRKALVHNPIFLQYLAELALKKEWSGAEVFRFLILQWERRELIPGYEDFHGWPSLPRGWSKKNLYRLLPQQEGRKILLKEDQEKTKLGVIKRREEFDLLIEGIAYWDADGVLRKIK